MYNCDMIDCDWIDLIDKKFEIEQDCVYKKFEIDLNQTDSYNKIIYMITLLSHKSKMMVNGV